MHALYAYNGYICFIFRVRQLCLKVNIYMNHINMARVYLYNRVYYIIIDMAIELDYIINKNGWKMIPSL